MKKIIACLLVAFQLAPSINAVLPVIKGQELLDTEHGPGLVQAYQNKFRPPNPADRPQAIRAFKSFIKKCSLKAADRVPGLADVNNHERAAMQAVFNMMKHRLTDGYYAGVDNHDPLHRRRHKINSALVNVSNILLVKRFYPAGDDIVLGDSFVAYARNIRALTWEQIVEMNGLAAQNEADKRILPDLLKSYVYNVIEMNAYGLEPTDAEKQNAWTLATIIQDKYSQSKMIPLIKATLLHWGHRPDGMSDEAALEQKRALYQQYAEVEHVEPAPLQLINFLQEHAAQEAAAEAMAQGAVDDEMAQGNDADVDGSDGEDDQTTAQLRDVTKTRSKEGRERGYENLAQEIQAALGDMPEDGQGGGPVDSDADESDDEGDSDGSDGQAGPAMGAGGDMETDDDGSDASDEDGDSDGDLPPAFGAANFGGGVGAAAAAAEEDSDDEDMQPVQVRQQRVPKELLTSDESDEEDDSTEAAEQDVTTKAKRRYVDAAAAAAAADSESDDDDSTNSKNAKRQPSLFDDTHHDENMAQLFRGIDEVFEKNNKQKMPIFTLARDLGTFIKNNEDRFFLKINPESITDKALSHRIKLVLEDSLNPEQRDQYIETKEERDSEKDQIIAEIFAEINRVQRETGEYITNVEAVRKINAREGFKKYNPRVHNNSFSENDEYKAGRKGREVIANKKWSLLKSLCDDWESKNRKKINPRDLGCLAKKNDAFMKLIKKYPFLNNKSVFLQATQFDRGQCAWPHLKK